MSTGSPLMAKTNRQYRLEVHVSEEEKRAVDEYWFRECLPSRSAALRDLLRQALRMQRDE
jgi:hypothetical protein